MATGYEKFSRDDLKKALSYLKRKDPENESLQKYDEYFRSYTNSPKKSVQGSVSLFDNALENNLGNKERTSKSVKGSDGGWESRGYGKEMEKRKKNPGDYSDSTIADKAQKGLKKKFGLEGVDEFITYVEAQKMAKERRENPEKFAPPAEKAINKLKDSRVVDKVMSALEVIDRPGDALRTGIKNKLDGKGFIEGVKRGWKDDEYTTSGKQLNKEVGFDPKGDAVDKVLANLLGRAVTQNTPLGLGSFLPQTKVGEETAGLVTEATLDPLNAVGLPFAAGGKALKVASKSLANAPELANAIGKAYGAEGLKAIEKALAEGKNLDDLLGVPQQKGNPSNVLANSKVEMPELPKGYNLPPQSPKEVVDEAVKPSLVRDDWFNFAERGTPAVRGGVPRADVSRGDLESIGSKADEILNLSNRLDGNRNAQLSEMQKLMDDLARSESEQAGQQLDEVWNTRQAEEDAFVQNRLAPFNSMQEQAAAAEAEWKSVQELQNQAKRIQQKYGNSTKYNAPKRKIEEIEEVSLEDILADSAKSLAEFKTSHLIDETAPKSRTTGGIYIPEGNQADWSALVPNRFKAGKNRSDMAFDIYKVADEEGFESVDEFIQHLQKLDEAMNTKLNDLRPADYMNMGGGRAAALEDAARMEFGNTDTAKGLDAYFNDLLKIQKDRNPDELYKRVRGESDPQSFDELIRLAQMEQNAANNPYKPDLKELMRRDPRIREALKAMTPAKQQQAIAAIEEASSTPRFNMDNLLDSLAPSPRKTPDELLREMAGKANADMPSLPKTPDAEVTNPPDGMLRMNVQAFNETANNPMVNTSESKKTVTAIDSTESKIKRGWAKFQENYINRNHSAKVTETRLLEENIKAAKAAGQDTKALEAQLKNVKKNGSDFEKALTNESAADAMTKDMLNRHFKAMFSSVKGNDKEVAKGLEYVMAKRLLYKMETTPDYKLPQGWTKERLMNIEAGGRGKYDEFVTAVQGLKKEQLDMRMQYGIINKESYDALMKDPYYIPLQRDKSFLKDNIDVGYNGSKNSNKRGVDEIIDEWGEGDLNSFYKNPLEVVVNNTYAVTKNALKNDTAQQMLRLAQMDADGMLVKKIPKSDYQKNGGIEVFVNGEKQYVRPQKDLMELINENDAGLSMDMAQKVTSFIAGLKTRSLEYQTGALLRDTAEAYIKSQAGPLRWFQHAYTAIKNGNKDAKQVGAYFEHAYKDHYGGIDPSAITKEYVKRHKNVKAIDLRSKESWKDLGRVITKVLDAPFAPVRMLGNYSDTLPREIEVLEATRKFNKANGGRLKEISDEIANIDRRLSAAQGNSDAFSSELAGIDTLAARKSELETELSNLNRGLKREQIYQGRDIMNYSRAGRGKASQAIRKYIMFANTTTQSKDKMVRSFVQNPVQTTVKAGIAVAPMVALQQVAFNQMSDADRAVFDDLPDYMTQYNYVFVKDGEVVALPKPHEMALLTNPIEDMMTGQPIEESFRLIAKELLPYQTGMLAQGFVPNADGSITVGDNAQVPGTAVTPAVDILANKKLGFNQKPISFGDKFKGEGETPEASKYTYDIFKNLLGDNPRAEYAQYAVQQYGGDPGKYLSALAEYATNPNNQEKIDNLLKNLNPLQDRFFSDDNRYFKKVPSK